LDWAGLAVEGFCIYRRYGVAAFKVFEFKVLETIPSSKYPSRGVLKLLVQIVKQDGTIAQEGVKAIIMKRH
jgi:hypothetical protein